MLMRGCKHFIRHLCKLEQEEYELEGIYWKKIEFEDNHDCLDLFEKKPMGLISILDKGSNSSKATDVTFTNKIKRHLTSNSCFSVEKGAFKVRHYAGEVHYDATGFLEQNRDTLQSDTIQLFLASRKNLLNLFASVSHEQSDGVKFKAQLFKLIQQLGNSKA